MQKAEGLTNHDDGSPSIFARITRIFTAFYSAEWSPQALGLAQPPGLAPKVEGAAPGSGAKVQSRATLLWGLTPVIPPATEDFTLGPDPSVQGLD